MNDRRARWTGGLLASLAGLTIASFLLHAAGGGPAAPAPRAAAAATEPEPAPPPERDEPVPPSAVVVEHRSASEDGYREAREATWEGTLTGQVLSPDGPIANLAVRAEWLLALRPDRDEIARLKRAGARRDRDGAWWAGMLASTDEDGCFRFENVPAVPVRLRAGAVTRRAEVGGFTELRTERP